MNYYKCCDCGHTFDEDDAGSYAEWEGEGVMRGQIYFMCCPECGSDAFEDADECMECGEIYSLEDELTVFDTEVMVGQRGKMQPKHVTLCNNCLEQIKKDIAAGKDEYGIADEVNE